MLPSSQVHVDEFAELQRSIHDCIVPAATRRSARGTFDGIVISENDSSFPMKDPGLTQEEGD